MIEKPGHFILNDAPPVQYEQMSKQRIPSRHLSIVKNGCQFLCTVFTFPFSENINKKKLESSNECGVGHTLSSFFILRVNLRKQENTLPSGTFARRVYQTSSGEKKRMFSFAKEKSGIPLFIFLRESASMDDTDPAAYFSRPKSKKSSQPDSCVGG
ncbi:hypothetical protein AVEN_8115-1 [Araneus ventricosus]|uniref:Uncharacterized protein n=1 Tax=Araneus ventricosus TaxID=182803 RepID=A0A4Y2W7I1_ARAVE|nr:hypothetical protein AVEN_8115-1 [Araneus ventricosus]